MNVMFLTPNQPSSNQAQVPWRGFDTRAA